MLVIQQKRVYFNETDYAKLIKEIPQNLLILSKKNIFEVIDKKYTNLWNRLRDVVDNKTETIKTENINLSFVRFGSINSLLRDYNKLLDTDLTNTTITKNIYSKDNCTSINDTYTQPSIYSATNVLLIINTTNKIGRYNTTGQHQIVNLSSPTTYYTKPTSNLFVSTNEKLTTNLFSTTEYKQPTTNLPSYAVIQTTEYKHRVVYIYKKFDSKIIIAIIVGSVGVISFFAILIICCCKKRASSNNKAIENNATTDNINSSNYHIYEDPYNFKSNDDVYTTELNNTDINDSIYDTSSAGKNHLYHVLEIE